MSEYRINDARNELDESPAIALADLAWARPHRNGVHVTYPTHKPIDLWEHVDAIMNSLVEGGWAIFDADDWLLPRLIQHLQTSWGDVAKHYAGGGYRRTGAVVYDGHGGAGHYFTNGGYHVVFAHKGETNRTTSERSKIVTSRVPKSVRNEVDWGTLKPIEPYRRWIEAVTDPDELVYVPHAGTAPGAIAAEGLNRDWIAVDSEPDAKTAFEKRKELQGTTTQTTL